MKSQLYLFLLLALPPVAAVAQPSAKDIVGEPVTIAFLQSFADAFNAHDLDKILSLMTDDCVFEASGGPDKDGERSVGKQAVRKAFEAVFTTYPDAHWSDVRHVVAGNRGFSEWVFTGTTAGGTKVEVTGCDLFTFRDGKIAIKNSYRKNRVLVVK
jgi:steroid delta-isomerase-like uncharacterized protein